MRFFVTGGTGFIGSHMVELILSQGWEVVCPVRNTASLGYLQETEVEVIPLKSIEDYTAEAPSFDYVIHLAGATRALDYEGYKTANVDLTKRLLELFSGDVSGSLIKRFVLVGSQASCGPCTDDCTPVCETDPTYPVSLYGRSKLEAEEVARNYAERVPITIVRPCTVFGPRDVDCLGLFSSPRYGIVAYIGGPDRLVSVIYVEDLVEGILKAALSPQGIGQTYFLSNRQPVVWREFALEVAKVMGQSVIGLPVPLPFLRGIGYIGDLIGKLTNRPQLFRSEKVDEMSQIAWVCSPEKAIAELDWTPRTPLEEAIRKTAAWYKQVGWI